MVREEVINAIDNIGFVNSEIEFAVMESMIDFFDKSFLIMEHSGILIDDAVVFQEAKKDEGIIDKVKKQGKKDNNKFITILLFIPRLLKTLAKTLLDAFKDGKIADKLKEVGNKLNKSVETRKKEAKVKELNKLFGDSCECYLDEKSGKIKFKKEQGELIGKACYVTDLTDGALDLFKKIKSQFDPNDPGKIRSLITDCDKLLKKDPSVSKTDLFEDGIGALGDVISTCNNAAGEISLIADGIQDMTRNVILNDIVKDNPNEDKQKLMADINQLSGKVNQISKLIAGSVSSLRVITSWGDKICNIINKKKAIVEEEDNNKLECLRYYTVNKYFKNGFKKDNPIQNGETDESYEERITRIRDAAVDRLFADRPEVMDEMVEYAEQHYDEWKKANKKSKKK